MIRVAIHAMHTDELPAGVNAIMEDGVLRIEWDNRRAQKDNYLFCALLLFWLFWVPVTLFATACLCYYIAERDTSNIFSFSLWLIGGWLGTFAIPLTMLMRRWSEHLEVTPTTLTFERRGWLAPKRKSWEINPQLAIGFGSSDDYPGPTLAIFESKFGFQRATIVGYWLKVSTKETVFCIVDDFVVATKVSLKVRRFSDKCRPF